MLKGTLCSPGPGIHKAAVKQLLAVLCGYRHSKAQIERQRAGVRRNKSTQCGIKVITAELFPRDYDYQREDEAKLVSGSDG